MGLITLSVQHINEVPRPTDRECFGPNDSSINTLKCNNFDWALTQRIIVRNCSAVLFLIELVICYKYILLTSLPLLLILKLIDRSLK